MFMCGGENYPSCICALLAKEIPCKEKQKLERMPSKY
jgi:hypothetical protein